MQNKSQIPYRLGVDIGTGSVAWAAMAMSENGQPTRLLASGTTIFGEPVLPKEMKLKNEERRRARLMRRQTERKRERISKIMHLAAALQITPERLASALLAHKETQTLWQLRVKALDQRVSLEEFFLIVLRLAKNRGYNGDAPKLNQKGDLGKVGQGLAVTRSLVEATPGVRTVAEAIWLSQVKLPLNQKKFRKRIETGTYVLRSDIKKEFDLILKEQLKHHAVLSKSLDFIYPLRSSPIEADATDKANPYPGTRYFWGQTPDSIGQAVKVAVFYQKPLQAFKDKIGTCALDKTSLRVVAAHPAHQAFRIEKLLADLRWGDSKSTDRLTPAQKSFLRAKLESTAEPSFSAVYKELDKAGLMQPDGLILNFHTPRRDHLRGNTTRARLRSMKLLDAFERLTTKQQSDVFIALADDVNSPETWRHDGARDFIVSEYGEAVAGFIDHIADSKDGLDRLRAMAFDAGRVSYGVPALEALTNAMRTENIDEHSAINKLYAHHHQRQSATGYLAEVTTLELRSPVVEHALLYTRRELLAAVKRLGTPQAMVIELAKEVKSTLEKRQETTRRQNRQEHDNAEARSEILKANCKITNASILRYKLWKEQSKRCPYSGEYIGSVEEAVSGSRYEIDHIVPQRLHGVGNRFEEVILATKRFNQIKSGHETPYLAAKRLGQAIWDWAATEQTLKLIESESKSFKRKAKIIQDKTEFRVDELDDEAFIDRQLQETQWIGRVVQNWCSQLCNDVTVVRGGLTAELRRDWGFHTVLEQVRIAEGRHDSEKAKTLFYKPNRVGELVFDKRSDHRHHLIDACVIALSTRQNYADAVKARNARAAGRKSSYATPECPIPSLREHLVKMMNGYCVWHVPDHKVAGLMFDQPFELGIDGKSLLKKGKLSRDKFNVKLDKLVVHTDRNGRKHQKIIPKKETACIRVSTVNGLEAVNITQFLEQYVRNGLLVVPKEERLIFKGDLLAFDGNKQVYLVSQLSTRDGILAIHAVETKKYDDLKNTRLNKSFTDASALLSAKVIRHPIELAIHAKMHKQSK